MKPKNCLTYRTRDELTELKPGFHMVVSVVSVVRKKFIGQIEFILSRTTSCICRFFCIEPLVREVSIKPGFHIVVSVVSVVRRKFIGQIQLYGNLPYKCSIQKKRQIQLFVRDRMNSIYPMNFFRTTDTTIWKPGLKLYLAYEFFSYDRHDRYDRYNDMETRLNYPKRRR